MKPRPKRTTLPPRRDPAPDDPKFDAKASAIRELGDLCIDHMADMLRAVLMAEGTPLLPDRGTRVAAAAGIFEGYVEELVRGYLAGQVPAEYLDAYKRSINGVHEFAKSYGKALYIGAKELHEKENLQ